MDTKSIRARSCSDASACRICGFVRIVGCEAEFPTRGIQEFARNGEDLRGIVARTLHVPFVEFCFLVSGAEFAFEFAAYAIRVGKEHNRFGGECGGQRKRWFGEFAFNFHF